MISWGTASYRCCTRRQLSRILLEEGWLLSVGRWHTNRRFRFIGRGYTMLHRVLLLGWTLTVHLDSIHGRLLSRILSNLRCLLPLKRIAVLSIIIFVFVLLARDSCWSITHRYCLTRTHILRAMSTFYTIQGLQLLIVGKIWGASSWCYSEVAVLIYLNSALWSHSLLTSLLL